MKKTEDINKIIGEKVKQYRLTKGLSIEELSEKSGICEKYLVRIEKFEAKKIALMKIIAIAEAMKVNVWELLSK